MGSLPHVDREEAIAFVLEHTPEVPAAPTLPRLEPLELMIPQAAWGIAGVTVADDGTISIADPAAVDPAAPLGDPELAGRPFGTWRVFLEHISDRTGPVKVQLTGPVTLALTLVAAGLGAPQAFEVAAAAVSQRAGHLLSLVERLAPGTSPLLVLDEPGLVGGLRTDLPIAGEALADVLSGVLAAVEGRAITGIHCCGPTDWHLLAQAGPDLLSLPVGAGVTESAGAIGSFLDRGGLIAWGAVATNEPLGEQPSRSWRQLSAQWCALVQAGCDPVLLRRQALVTPVCGLATHDVNQADHVFGITRRLAEKIHDQVTGIRLSVGA